MAGAPEPWDWDRLPVIEAEYRELLGEALPRPRQLVVDRYMDGFRAGDHATILGCLTDDVTWDIVGHATAAGSERVRGAHRRTRRREPPPAHRRGLTSEGTDLVAAFGAGEFDDADGTPHTFRFADAFTFRGDRISACRLVRRPHLGGC